MLKPHARSAFRRFMARIYFPVKKWVYWHWPGNLFATRCDLKPLSVVAYSHSSPTLRSLPGVNMQLQYNKIVNLSLAIKKLNGLILNPGERFSYWKCIGRPSANKGYKTGMILRQGQVMEGIGGGLCQLSNLLYWMTLHTPLTVTERWRHSYDVFPDSSRTLPFGSGATCSYPNIDLEIANLTDQPFQLTAFLRENFLCGEWRTAKPLSLSYEVYESKGWIKHEWWGAYTRHNILRRKIRHATTGKELADHLITENHALMMYEPFLESERVKNLQIVDKR